MRIVRAVSRRIVSVGGCARYAFHVKQVNGISCSFHVKQSVVLNFAAARLHNIRWDASCPLLCC